jgi:hypothetical protein
MTRSNRLLTKSQQSPHQVELPVIIGNGGVGERLKPAVLKTVRPERVSGVRIPPPPPASSAFVSVHRSVAEISTLRPSCRECRDAPSVSGQLQFSEEHRFPAVIAPRAALGRWEFRLSSDRRQRPG